MCRKATTIKSIKCVISWTAVKHRHTYVLYGKVYVMHCSTKSPLLPVNSSIYTKDREVGRGKIVKIATDLVLGSHNIIAAVIFS